MRIGALPLRRRCGSLTVSFDSQVVWLLDVLLILVHFLMIRVLLVAFRVLVLAALG